MENFAYQNGTIAMMRSMHTSFRRPAKTGKRITATARLEESADREMSVTATLTQDKLIAEGSAKLIALTQERIESLGIAQP